MKQYTIKATDTTSADILLNVLPGCSRRCSNENVKTYMHKTVEVVMKRMKHL